jgi:hypothetical protein
MTRLERASLIAGIASAVFAAVGIAWSVWTYVPHSAIGPESSTGIDSAFRRQMEIDAARYKRFAQASEAASYAQGNVKRGLNSAEQKIYDAAAQKLRDAMHITELGGRDEESLRLYDESRELFERLR